MNIPDVNFENIRACNGSKEKGFEEFCCQLAQLFEVPSNSEFSRFKGEGGDGGVECVWKLPNNEEWGWQAKYVFDLTHVKSQLDKSIKTALEIHPNLTKYFICLPFNLTGPTGRKGKSETERFEEYKKKWESLATHKKMSVEFFLWDKTILLEKLIATRNSTSIIKFWFNKTLFDEEWFRKHIERALEHAKPRYSPELGIEMPIYKNFEAFGKTPSWITEINQKINDIKKLYERWDSVLSINHSKHNLTPEISEKNAEEIKNLSKILREIEKIFLDCKTEKAIEQLIDLLKSANEIVSNLKEQFNENLEKKYGKGIANNIPYRQYINENICGFPTADYDLAVEINEKLNELEKWVVLNKLMFENCIMIIGPAGIGKTHTICDIASMRLNRGLKSIVLFGEHFIDGEPWEQIRQNLGVHTDSSKDDLLTALDILGETTQFPVIIFIDALNETRTGDFWKRYLKLLIEDIKQYKWLKLCFTCRSTYTDVVLPDGLEIPKIEHRGFKGIEFDASNEFFNYYDLPAPTLHFLQPEFSNPLFLKLFCEAFKDDKTDKISYELISFSEVVNHFIESKAKRISNCLGYHPNNQLTEKAVLEIVKKMQKEKRNWLSWEEANEICFRLWQCQKRSESLLDTLIQEGILREDRISGNNIVLFSFERLGDFLLAQHFVEQIKNTDSLEKSFKPDGMLYFSIQNLKENMGLLESLAILIPEKFNKEINEVIKCKKQDSQIISLVIESIRWRKPSSITKNTQRIIEQALKDTETFSQTMDVLFSKSILPGHPLNAEWFYQISYSIPMVLRDSQLAPYLHLKYDSKGSVHRLIEWSFRVEPTKVQDEVIRLCALILGWFLSASDRRVRDNATKAIVRLMESHCNLWPEIIDRFFIVDDDYILERLLAAAYGSLIRSGDNEALENTATKVFELLFKNKETTPSNVMIRDYGRLILELALYKNVLHNDIISPKDFNPPYISKLPDNLPSDNEILELENSFKGHRFYDAVGILIDSMQPEYNTLRKKKYGDFGRYIFGNVLNNWDIKNITFQELSNFALKMIFDDFGYNIDNNGKFDMDMVFKYGYGRGKPFWAERIGKKYQWISLYRLVGLVSDNFKLKEEPIHDFYGRELKNIDPTFLDRNTKTSNKNRSWWTPKEYDFEKYKNISHSKWLRIHDFPDSDEMRIVKDPKSGEEYYVLLSFPEWSSQKDEEYPYRLIWMETRSLILPIEKHENFWNSLKNKSFHEIGMFDSNDLYKDFIGEYPWSITYRKLFERCSKGGEMLLTSNTLIDEKEYDASIDDSLRIEVPAREFFLKTDLRWDGRGSYLFDNSTVFKFPSIYESGPHSLLVEKSFLENFLKEEKLILIWLVRSEKQIIEDFTSSQTGFKFPKYSRVYMLKEGKILSTKELIETF